jgi:hypothetical protein
VQAVLFALLVLVASQLGLGRAVAQDAIVASVNGRPITETDMRYAEIDLGSELEAIAPEKSPPRSARISDRKSASVGSRRTGAD